MALVVVVFFGLFLRLFHLQIVEGQKNRELADGNRIQIKVIHAPRGVIFDRNGKILASNAPAFRLSDPDSKKSTIVSREDALEMEAKQDPRFDRLEIDNVRSYPDGEKAAHLLGYVSEITEDQLKKLNDPQNGNYHFGDRIGQSGIESVYENLLRGRDGGEIIEADASGKKLRTIRTVPPVAGKNVYLTVDAEVQNQLYDQLKAGVEKAGSCCGAAVAEDPLNGQILALVSYPSFDNNLFTSANVAEDKLSQILTSPQSPILNRAIGGTYPPGSTFKILTSMAALGSGKITPDTIFEDNGQLFLGPYKFTNWYFTQYGKVEGPVNMIKALQRSNDTYYYQVAQTIGEKTLIDWSKQLLFGLKLGIDLPGEAGGLVADNDWKLKNTGQVWYPGDTLHMAIGQGFLLVTPLQILGLTSFIASDGHYYQPTLFLKAAEGDQTVMQFKAKTLLSNVVAQADIKVIKAGMSKVPKDGGTAWPFFTFPIVTAGKTGTAEFGDPKNKTHAWYTSFAPADNPKIALTVLVEAGGEGSNVSAPIAKEFYRWYFSPDKKSLLKDIYQVSTDSAKTLGE